MTTTVNAANGGKVWKPDPTEAFTPAASVKNSNPSLMITLCLIIAIAGGTFLGIMLAFYGGVPVKTVQRTDSVLILEYTSFQTEEVLTELKSWAPEALKVNPTTVNQVNLDSFDDGTPGTIQLTDGSSIPFTIHSYQGNTFTVTKD